MNFARSIVAGAPAAPVHSLGTPRVAPVRRGAGRRVAFICLGDARDPHYSSGSPFGMRKGFIDIGCDVIDVLSIRPTRRETLYLPQRCGFRLAGRHYSADRAPACLTAMAREIARRLDGIDPDLIFAAHSIPLSRVRSRAPLVFSHDQSFVERMSYVPYERRPLAGRYVRQAIAQEREAFAGAALCVYPSARALNSLRQDYHVPEEKLALVPWGGNLPSDPEADDVEAMIAARGETPIRLTFIGVDWERKGGEDVLATAALLAAGGLPVELTLIGCTVKRSLPSYVRVIPFLDKRTPEGLSAFLDILGRSHFLFVPSLAEAYGHVFCEAAALGVPSIARDVGGIPTIIVDGVTGHCLAPDATAADFAAAIMKTMADPAAYRAMAGAARARYERRLNWSAFATEVLDRVDALEHGTVPAFPSAAAGAT